MTDITDNTTQLNVIQPTENPTNKKNFDSRLVILIGILFLLSLLAAIVIILNNNSNTFNQKGSDQGVTATPQLKDMTLQKVVMKEFNAKISIPSNWTYTKGDFENDPVVGYKFFDENKLEQFGLMVIDGGILSNFCTNYKETYDTVVIDNVNVTTRNCGEGEFDQTYFVIDTNRMAFQADGQLTQEQKDILGTISYTGPNTYLIR